MLKLGKTYSEGDLVRLAGWRAAKVECGDARAFRGFFADSLNRGHWWADEAVQMVRIAPPVAVEAETADEFARLAADAAAHAAAADEFARLATASDGRAAYEAWCADLDAHYLARGGDWFGIRPPAWREPLVHSTGSGRTLLWWEQYGFRGLLICRPALPGWEAPDFDVAGTPPWGGTIRGSTPVFSRLFETSGSQSIARETIRLRPGRLGFFATLTRTLRVDSSYAPAPGPWAVLEVGTIGGGGADPGSVAEARHLAECGLPIAAEDALEEAARTAIDAAFGTQDWTEPARAPEAVPEAVADVDVDVEAD